MKQPEQSRDASDDTSPLPRFLRGLFHRSELPNPSEKTPGEQALHSQSDRILPAMDCTNGHSPKVLVVDDDPVILKTVGIKLSGAGFEVITGHDGAEAITTARKEHPDVIVLDVLYPPDVAHGGTVAWDGLRVMQWLRRLENGHTPPIIIITGLNDDDIRERALACGALAFLQKPIDNDALIEAINKALASRAPNHAAPAHEMLVN